MLAVWVGWKQSVGECVRAARGPGATEGWGRRRGREGGSGVPIRHPHKAKRWVHRQVRSERRF